MVARARPAPEPVRATLSASAAREVREGILQARRSEFVDLTKSELRHYLDTGELPERIQRWLESSGSRPAT